MTSEEAAALRESWKARGGERCDHLSVEKERDAAGVHTGDYVCTTCGATRWGDDWSPDASLR